MALKNAVCFDYRLRGTQWKSAILLIKLGYQIHGIWKLICVLQRPDSRRSRAHITWLDPFVAVQSLGHVGRCDPRQQLAPLPSTIYQSLLKLMSVDSVMSSNHLILCFLLSFLPSIFPSIRAFSNESALHIRWPKYWSFGISPSNEYWFPLGRNRSRCFSETPLLSPLSNGCWQFDLWILCLFSTQLVHLKVLGSCTAEAWLERFWA